MAHSQSATLAIVIGVGLITMSASPLEARGGGHYVAMHSFGHGMHGMRANAFAGAGHRRDNPYLKAASDERDKLLDKLKSICRGC